MHRKRSVYPTDNKAFYGVSKQTSMFLGYKLIFSILFVCFCEPGTNCLRLQGMLFKGMFVTGQNREPGLVDRVLALHAGSRGFDSYRGHMSERFFRSNRPGYPHPVSSELEISGIRVAVGDCSVIERRRWRPPYQTGKTVHVHAKHYKHNVDGRTAPGVCGNGSVPLSHSGNVVTRIGIHTDKTERRRDGVVRDVQLWYRRTRDRKFCQPGRKCHGYHE